MLKTLIQTKLPAYISKKRLIINFISLYFRTLLSAFNSGPERRTIIFNNNSFQIPSGVWGEFTKIFKIYFKWIAIKYLLNSTIVRRTMLPNSPKDFENFTQHRITISEYFNGTCVPDRINTILSTVPIVFDGVSKELIENWLWSYFWPFYIFREHIPRESAINNWPVELGAGTGFFSLAIGSVNKQSRAAVFDLPVILHLSTVIAETLGRYGVKVPDTYRTNNLDELLFKVRDNKYSVYSFWAFTEFPHLIRDNSLPLINKAEFTIIASNPMFEGVDNMLYFKSLEKHFPQKKIFFAPIDWHPYPGHNYVLIK